MVDDPREAHEWLVLVRMLRRGPCEPFRRLGDEAAEILGVYDQAIWRILWARHRWSPFVPQEWVRDD
jgi:hypothetical protein